MSQVSVITNITKEYPDMIHIIVFKEPRVFVKSDYTKRPREIVPEHYAPSVSSLSRTKTLIKDIVLCNDFELFCTFTFNPKKVDSFSLPRCWQKMSTWLHHQSNLARENGKEFKYLIIPEQHESGRWHFHALISGYVSTIKNSGCKTSAGRDIYNITSFRSGFTTASYVDSKEGVSQYVTKYITKDFVKKFNQRRFFCSRNLVRPKRELNSRVFSKVLPLFKRCSFEDSSSCVYNIKKSLLTFQSPSDNVSLTSHNTYTTTINNKENNKWTL